MGLATKMFMPVGLGGMGVGKNPFSKKKSASNSFEYQPYSGLRPPRVDYTDASGKNVEILRPTQKAIFDTLMRRSQGQDVGYDPARKSAAIALLESKIGKQREDDVRTAQGRVAASGLSGNLRAQEALTGRVNRDSARTLGEGINALNIEDLTRANEERDVNTSRLQNFNLQNFGQENTAANFDLDVYGAEQNNRLGAFGANEGVRRYDQTRSDENFSDLTGLALNGADMYLKATNPTYAGASSVAALAGGKGIANEPSQTPSFYNQPLKKTGAYRALMR